MIILQIYNTIKIPSEINPESLEDIPRFKNFKNNFQFFGNFQKINEPESDRRKPNLKSHESYISKINVAHTEEQGRGQRMSVNEAVPARR